MLDKKIYQEIVEEALDIVATDFKIKAENNELDTLQLIEELVNYIETQKQEIKEIQNDLEYNYKPISREEQIGWNHSW